MDSVGHLIIDSLASRLGVHMISDRALGGLVGETVTTVGNPGALIKLTLFKTSELPRTDDRNRF